MGVLFRWSVRRTGPVDGQESGTSMERGTLPGVLRPAQRYGAQIFPSLVGKTGAATLPWGLIHNRLGCCAAGAGRLVAGLDPYFSILSGYVSLPATRCLLLVDCGYSLGRPCPALV